MKSYRRHPAEVTAARLAEHYELWFDLMDEVDRQAIERVQFVLEAIASGERSPS